MIPQLLFTTPVILVIKLAILSGIIIIHVLIVIIGYIILVENTITYHNYNWVSFGDN